MCSRPWFRQALDSQNLRQSLYSPGVHSAREDKLKKELKQLDDLFGLK